MITQLFNLGLGGRVAHKTLIKSKNVIISRDRMKVFIKLESLIEFGHVLLDIYEKLNITLLSYYIILSSLHCLVSFF